MWAFVVRAFWFLTPASPHRESGGRGIYISPLLHSVLYSRHNNTFLSMKRNDLTGQRFHRLVVTGVHALCAKKNVLWACMCDCGKFAKAYAYDLRAGKVKSCGCLSKEHRPRTHGMAGAGRRRSATYNLWASMLQRCTNPNDRNYRSYGARGITVCERWHKFENFYADMGQKPEGMSLDRIDNDGGYNKDNCRWASLHTQSRNKRSNIFVSVQGRRMVLADALVLLNSSIGRMHYWMRKLSTDHQGVIDSWLKQKKQL